MTRMHTDVERFEPVGHCHTCSAPITERLAHTEGGSVGFRCSECGEFNASVDQPADADRTEPPPGHTAAHVPPCQPVDRKAESNIGPARDMLRAALIGGPYDGVIVESTGDVQRVSFVTDGAEHVYCHGLILYPPPNVGDPGDQDAFIYQGQQAEDVVSSAPSGPPPF